MHIKRRLLITLIVLCICIAFGPAMYCSYGLPGSEPAPDAAEGAETGKDAAAVQSSFEYKKYADHSEYRKDLKWKMTSVHSAIAGYMDDDRTIPIPGLVRTYTSHDGIDSESSSYIPQGLCKAGGYFLITAYDAEKINNSVIYVVDASSRQVVSTLTLPNTFHAGGIAFDGKEIWLTGDTSDAYKGAPFVQYIKYDVFLNMLNERLHEVKPSEMSGYVYIKNKPSFLECDGGRLWVGTYIGRKGTAEGYMNGYRITDGEDNGKLNTTLYAVISGIDSSSQGADIEGNYLYVSSSYKGSVSGLKTSFITKYEISPLNQGMTALYVKNREVTRVEVPKMNEEILVEGGEIHINFESAADAWKKPVIVTDRILAVRQSCWER